MNRSLVSQAPGFITDKDKDELTNGYRDVIAEIDPEIKSIESTLREEKKCFAGI